MDIVLNGMPPLYYGWKDICKNLEDLLAVYSATLNLNSSFEDNIFTITGCKRFDIINKMINKKNEYLTFVEPDELENVFKNSVCESCKSQINRLALENGNYVKKVTIHVDKCEFEFG